MLKISLPKKIPLLTLVNYFILCQPVLVKMAGKKNKVLQRPQPHSAMEELQVMVSLVKKIEEQGSIDPQFYMFEAVFGSCIGVIKVYAQATLAHCLLLCFSLACKGHISLSLRFMIGTCKEVER